MPIQLHTEEIVFSLKNEQAICKWIQNVISEHQYKLIDLNYIFCSDEYLLKINQEYLAHDYYTDIITFDNSENEAEIEADLFISIDRVQDNSNQNESTFDDELHRVMIHGVLHLLGFGDKTEEEIKEMRQKENDCLSLLAHL